MNPATRLSSCFLVLCMVATAVAADETKVFIASDDSIEITVGSNWSSYRPADSIMTLNLLDDSGKRFIQAETLLRSDFSSDLQGYALSQAERLSRREQSGNPVSEPKEIQINGQRAYQSEVHWTDRSHFRWGSLITCVETDRYFVAIVESVPESDSKDSLAKLAELVKTVRELPSLGIGVGNSATQPSATAASTDNMTNVFYTHPTTRSR